VTVAFEDLVLVSF